MTFSVSVEIFMHQTKLFFLFPIEIYDWDTSDSGVTQKLGEQDLIGRIETNMASLVSVKNYSAVLRNNSNRGEIITQCLNTHSYSIMYKDSWNMYYFEEISNEIRNRV